VPGNIASSRTIERAASSPRARTLEIDMPTCCVVPEASSPVRRRKTGADALATGAVAKPRLQVSGRAHPRVLRANRLVIDGENGVRSARLAATEQLAAAHEKKLAKSAATARNAGGRGALHTCPAGLAGAGTECVLRKRRREVAGKPFASLLDHLRRCMHVCAWLPDPTPRVPTRAGGRRRETLLLESTFEAPTCTCSLILTALAVNPMRSATSAVSRSSMSRTPAPHGRWSGRRACSAAPARASGRDSDLRSPDGSRGCCAMPLAQAPFSSNRQAARRSNSRTSAPPALRIFINDALITMRLQPSRAARRRRSRPCADAARGLLHGVAPSSSLVEDCSCGGEQAGRSGRPHPALERARTRHQRLQQQLLVRIRVTRLRGPGTRLTVRRPCDSASTSPSSRALTHGCFERAQRPRPRPIGEREPPSCRTTEKKKNYFPALAAPPRPVRISSLVSLVNLPSIWEGQELGGIGGSRDLERHATPCGPPCRSCSPTLSLEDHSVYVPAAHRRRRLPPEPGRGPPDVADPRRLPWGAAGSSRVRRTGARPLAAQSDLHSRYDRFRSLRGGMAHYNLGPRLNDFLWEYRDGRYRTYAANGPPREVKPSRMSGMRRYVRSYQETIQLLKGTFTFLEQLVPAEYRPLGRRDLDRTVREAKPPHPPCLR